MPSCIRGSFFEGVSLFFNPHERSVCAELCIGRSCVIARVCLFEVKNIIGQIAGELTVDMKQFGDAVIVGLA